MHGELTAFARQTRLLRHDARHPVIPDRVAPGDDVVVFVHGLFATAGMLRPLRAAVETTTSIHASALTYAPGTTLPEVAELLTAHCEELGDVRLHLVGHSLGGVVTRLVALDAAHLPVVQTISLAAPFAGVPRARYLSMVGVGELDAGGALIRRVRLGVGRVVPHLSIVAELDQFVRPPLAHVLPGGDVHIMRGRGHNALLFDPEVLEAVARRVAAAAKVTGEGST